MYFYVELELFLQLITGTRHITSEHIPVDFTDGEHALAISIAICNNSITLSTRIVDLG